MKNGCPNQSSKQLTPNDNNNKKGGEKRAETTSKTQTVAYLHAQGGKTHHQITSLIDYRLQQTRGRLQSNQFNSIRKL